MGCHGSRITHGHMESQWDRKRAICQHEADDDNDNSNLLFDFLGRLMIFRIVNISKQVCLTVRFQKDIGGLFVGRGNFRCQASEFVVVPATNLAVRGSLFARFGGDGSLVNAIAEHG